MATIMDKLLNFVGKSQYDQDIDVHFRPSACGPVTAHVIMNNLFINGCPYNVNELYRLLGSTKIGLFKWRFIRNMRKILGPEWIVKQCTINEVKRQIDEGRPVAAKFDRWFSLRWYGKFSFDYHWVPVVGYEQNNRNDLILFIHDNGGKNRSSKIRRIPYKVNQPILSFIKIEPTFSK